MRVNIVSEEENEWSTFVSDNLLAGLYWLKVTHYVKPILVIVPENKNDHPICIHSGCARVGTSWDYDPKFKCKPALGSIVLEVTN